MSDVPVTFRHAESGARAPSHDLAHHAERERRAAEREGQERLNWLIEGFAIWAVLFSIPVVAWMRQKRQRTLGKNEPLPS